MSRAALKEIGRTEAPQGQSAYDRLVEDIRSGRLAPGDRLIEVDLAERLGISRTPVREAIRRLESDGLVVHEPRIGAVVRQLDYAEIAELYEMRVVLEATAAAFAARAASDMEVAELAAINDEMRAARDDRAIYETNRQFHAVLLNAARNRFLLRAVDAIQKTLLILGPTTLGESSRAEAAIDEHDTIVAALRDRDGPAAERAMRQHIEGAYRARLRLSRDREGRI